MESMGRVRLSGAYARTVSFDGLAIIGFKLGINKTESQVVIPDTCIDNVYSTLRVDHRIAGYSIHETLEIPKG